MRCTVILVALPLVAMASEPEPLVRLGSDRFRQSEGVTAIAYSADGKMIATADGPSIHIWDAADGKRLRTGPGPEKYAVLALGFGADGRALYVAARTEGKGVVFRQLDATSGKEVASTVVASDRKEGHLNPEARFSPDGRFLVVVTEDRSRLQVVDTATQKEAWAERRPEVKVTALAFRADCKALAVAHSAAPVRVLELLTGEIIHQYKVEGGAISNMAFSPDGKSLVGENSNPWPNHVVRFDADTGEVRWTYRADRVLEPFVTPDGKSVVYFGSMSHSPDPDMWHWLDVATGRPRYVRMDTGLGNAVAIRPDGRVLAVGGYDGQITQWDLEARKRLVEASADPAGPVTDLRFGRDGRTVSTGAGYEWDVTTGRQTRIENGQDAGASERVIVSPDRRWAVRATLPGRVRFAAFAAVEIATGRRHVFPKAQLDDRADFLSDGRLLIHRTDQVAVYDPDTGDRVAQIKAGGRTGAIAASADGTTAISMVPAGDHLHTTRYDLTSGKPVGEWDGRPPDPSLMDRSGLWRAALSPDGRVLAVVFNHLAHPGMGFNRIEEVHTALFDARTGRYLSGWQDVRFWANLAFGPDRRTVACYYPSGLGVDIREVATGERRRRRSGPLIHSAAFSPDGRLIALATGPTPVALWDLIGKPAGPWADQKPGNLWDGLASEDAELAFGVIRTLRHHPAEAVAFLKERVKVPTAPAAEWVAGRVKTLDAPQFRDREQATADLAGAGELIVPELRAALKTASPEARRRLEGLLEKVTVPSRETWRTIRACEALEGIGTAEARELLATWAKGPPAATLTREAAEAAERLAKCGKK